jgi:hypothetical protein
MNDVVSARRKASALLAMSPDVADPVDAAHLFTAARLRFLRNPHSFWLEGHLLQVPLAQDVWPNIPAYLAQLGKDLVSKFISTNANSTSVAACQKVLHLDMRDIDSQTEFPAEQYTYSQTPLYDSREADVSDAGVLAVADRHWDTLVADVYRRGRDTSRGISGRRKKPGIGFSVRGFIQIPAFGGSGEETKMLGHRWSPNAGAYAGDSVTVTVTPPDGNGPRLRGMLIRYQKMQSPGANGNFLSTLWNGVKSAAGTVGVIATAIGGLGEPRKQEADQFDVFSPEITPERLLNSRTVAIPYPVPQGWLAAHFPHCTPSRPAVFSRLFGASVAADNGTTTIALTFWMKVRADFVIAEVLAEVPRAGDHPRAR